MKYIIIFLGYVLAFTILLVWELKILKLKEYYDFINDMSELSDNGRPSRDD